MRTIHTCLYVFCVALVSVQCNQPNKDQQSANNGKSDATTKESTATVRKINLPDTMAYHRVAAKAWIEANSSSNDFDKVLAVNRTDTAGLKAIDSITVPVALNGDVAAYLPFPASLPALQAVNKIILFSYPAQAFAAYEKGALVYAGATNMGRKKDTTPTGLFFCNWKAEETTSSFNDEWNLRWNFNVENKLGVGFHQYAMPGYPASHSCMRLMEKDAKFLYGWAEQWVLDEKDENVEKAKGTPVIIFGQYPFGSAKPWMALLQNPHALDLSAEVLQQTIAPYVPEVMAQQQKRAAVLAGAKTTAARP